MRVWAKDQPVGAEAVDVTPSGAVLAASGFAIGTKPAPHRVEYQLATVERYLTAQLDVGTEGRVGDQHSPSFECVEQSDRSLRAEQPRARVYLYHRQVPARGCDGFTLVRVCPFSHTHLIHHSISKRGVATNSLM
jgi:hypothetical protein